MDKAKPFGISKREVWEAYKRVKANQGAAGVDGQSIDDDRRGNYPNEQFDFLGYTFGLGELAVGGVEVHVVPGYWGSVVVEPRVRVLADRLRACLGKAQAANSGS